MDSEEMAAANKGKAVKMLHHIVMSWGIGVVITLRATCGGDFANIGCYGALVTFTNFNSTESPSTILPSMLVMCTKRSNFLLSQ